MILLSTIATWYVVFVSAGKTSPIGVIGIVSILSGLSGLFQAFFWPSLMGWLSVGFEGQQLNKRLGWFNASWSSGRLSGPLLGGILVQRSSLVPLAVMAICVTLSFVAITLAKSRRESDHVFIPSEGGKSLPNSFNESYLRSFVWMSRIAFFTLFVCIGLVRSQLGLLFKFELDFSESDFGMVISVLSAAAFAVMVFAGRFSFWHFRIGIFLGVQIVMLASMFTILLRPCLPIFFLITTGLGFAQGFTYVSHLYYGVYGSKKRSVRMAVHEITLSLGMFIGAPAGGYLSDHFGRQMPYWFGIAVLALGLTSQAIVWFVLRPRKLDLCPH